MADLSFVMEILASFTESQKNLDAFAKDITKTTKKIESDFSVIKLASLTGAINQGIELAKKLAVVFNEPIKQAAEYEFQVNQLRIALDATGQSTDETVKSFEDFAQSLQESTRFSDDAVLSTSALIQNLGQLSGQALKDATKAALDLSSALGIDLDTAARLVGKAANGNVEAFKKYGIEVRKGTTDTESFGNALEVINQRFGGASEKSVNTYAGAVDQLGNAFDDALKEIGNLLIKNPDVISGINSSAKAFSDFAGILKDFAPAISGAISKLINLGKSIEDFIFDSEGLKVILDDLEKQRQVNIDASFALNALNELKILNDATKASISENIKAGEIEAAKARQQQEDETAKTIEKIVEQYKNGGLSELQIIKKNRDESLKAIDNAEKFGITIVGGAAQLRNKIISESELKMTEVLEKENEKRIKKQQELASAISAASAGIPAFIENLKKLNDANATKEEKLGAGIAASINSVKQGAEGARQAVVATLTAAATAVLGPLGQALGPLFDALSQGPEAVKKMITEFVSAIPKIIENILLAIPALIQALIASIPVLIDGLLAAIPTIIQGFIDSIPLLIETLVNLAPDIITALINNLPQLVSSLAFLMPQIALSFATSLISNIPQIVQNFIDQFILGIPRIIAGIAEGVKDAIGKATGGIGGKVSGGFKSIGKKLGFADGGIVPGGFPNDSFPAQLTSGEGVVPNDTMRRLDQFLSGTAQGGGGSGGTTIIKLVVGEQELASVLLSLSQRGFRIN